MNLLFQPPVSAHNESGLSLASLIDRISRHPAVQAVVLLGSTGQPSHTKHSDYDLLLVLDRMPASIRVLVTTIEGRMADIIFVTHEKLAQAVDDADGWEADSWEALYCDWLRSGTISFEHNGVVSALQETLRAQRARWTLVGEAKQYELVAKINYNVRQSERLVYNPDPAVQIAVDIRLLYSVLEVFSAYFSLRNLPYRGEKEAVYYLQKNDPVFLQLFEQHRSETDRQASVARYHELAEYALAPVNGLWPRAFTSVSLDAVEWDMDDVQAGLAFWDSLVQDQAEQEKRC